MALSKDDAAAKQEKYLREATRYYSGIEKPLKDGPSVASLQELIAALHSEFESNFVSIEMVNHLLLAYKSNPKEWQRFSKFDRYKYTRNLVDEGNGKFNLMLLCWGEGHGSTIHDHADSHCFMKILKGDLVETQYKMPAAENAPDPLISDFSPTDNQILNSGDLGEIGQRKLALNQVAYINDHLGLHRVENPSHTDTAVSLHLYCPPFSYCSVFDENSGERVKCPVTFWSKYGIRQPTNAQ